MWSRLWKQLAQVVYAIKILFWSLLYYYSTTEHVYLIIDRARIGQEANRWYKVDGINRENE